MRIYSNTNNELILRFLGKDLWVKIHTHRWQREEDYYVRIVAIAKYPDYDYEPTYFCNCISAHWVDEPVTEYDPAVGYLSSNDMTAAFDETARFSASDLDFVTPLSVYTSEELEDLLMANQIFDDEDDDYEDGEYDDEDI